VKTRYTLKTTLYSDTPKDSRKPWTKYGVSFYPVFHGNFDVKASKEFPTEILTKLLTTREDDDEHTNLYKLAYKILSTSKEFRKIYERGYTQAVYIHSYDSVNPTRRYVPREEELRSVDISIYNKYVHTTVNIECETLRDAIKKGEHVENECWINAITDNYKNYFNTKRLQEKLS
jgi:hypothetical protein